MAEADQKSLMLQNAQLKAELKRLQAIEAEREAKEEKKTVAESDSGREQAARRVFEKYDRDNSGAIDKSELAYLFNDVQPDRPLNKQELEEAFKALDVNNDGQISLEEFLKWFLSDGAQVSEKKTVQLAALKAELAAGWFTNVTAPALIRSLSDAKVDENDTAFAEHHYGIAIGEIKDPEASLDISASFCSPDEFADIFSDDSPSTVAFELLFEVRGDLDANTACADLQATLGAALEDQPVDAKYSATDTHVKVELFPMLPLPDPFAMAAMLGFDMTQFLKKCQLRVEIQNFLSVLDSQNPDFDTLAGALKFNVSADVQFRKAYVWAAMGAFGKAAEKLTPLALIGESKLALTFGDVEELLDAIAPPEGVDQMAQLQQVQAAQIQQLQSLGASPEVIAAVRQQHDQAIALQRQGGLSALVPPWARREFWLSPKYKDLIRKALSIEMPLHDQKVELLRTLKESFCQLSSITVRTKSGFKLEVETQNLPNFKYLPNTVRDPDTQAWKTAPFDADGEGQA